MNKPYNQTHGKKSEILLGIYVTIEFMLLITASKIEHLVANGKLIFNITIMVILIGGILSGIATFLFRKIIFNFKKPVSKDANELLNSDIFTMLYVGVLFLIGLIALASSPSSVNALYLLILTITIFILGINTYFSNFWYKEFPQKRVSSSIEALKLEHAEWISIFNNLLLAFIILLGGVVISNFFLPIKSIVGTKDNSSFTLEVILIILLIMCNLLGAAIMWLLRPTHVTLVAIRNEIAKIR